MNKTLPPGIHPRPRFVMPEADLPDLPGAPDPEGLDATFNRGPARRPEPLVRDPSPLNAEGGTRNADGAKEATATEPRTHLPDPPSLRDRTKAYALRIIRLYGALPATTVAQVIGKQLLRSGTAVGANYREGTRARSTSEMIAKFGICIQELDESAYWLELLIEAAIITQSRLAPLLSETDQLLAILIASSKRLNQRQNAERGTLKQEGQ